MKIFIEAIFQHRPASPVSPYPFPDEEAYQRALAQPSNLEEKVLWREMSRHYLGVDLIELALRELEGEAATKYHPVGDIEFRAVAATANVPALRHLGKPRPKHSNLARNLLDDALELGREARKYERLTGVSDDS